MKKLCSIYLDEALHKAVKVLAASTGRNISDVVTEAVTKYLNTKTLEKRTKEVK